MNTSYNYADFIGLNLNTNPEKDSQDYEITTRAQTESKKDVQLSLLNDKPKPAIINN